MGLTSVGEEWVFCDFLHSVFLYVFNALLGLGFLGLALLWRALRAPFLRSASICIIGLPPVPILAKTTS
jgi:hypothetical protein